MHHVRWKPPRATRSALLCALAVGGSMALQPAQAVDFGDRTPEVSELTKALKPPRIRRGPVSVSSMAGVAAGALGSASMQIGFDFGSSRVVDRDLEKITRLSLALSTEELRELRYEVIGHTDAAGPASYNMKLSLQRAQAVLEQLVRQGIDRGRLVASGKGPTEPLNKADPLSAENRRVELLLIERPGSP